MSSTFVLKKTTKGILAKYGIHPSKSLGQNFLIDKLAVKRVIKAANLDKKDSILEIGPGLGVLTEELAKGAGQVIAIEKDPRLIRILNNELRMGNVKVVLGNILKIPSSSLNLAHSYGVVANLPFYLTAPVIRRFLESKNPPQKMVLVVQKEVGQRICARPPKMNLLAVSVQFYAEPKIVSYISKKSFWPEPKVDSAIIKISDIKRKKSNINADLFFRIVKAGFAQPRKQLVNNLSIKLKIDKERMREILQKNRISPARRPETLTIGDWIKLTEAF